MLLLYVEDSERLRRSVSLGLRQLGWAVDVAADGIEGWYRACEVAYDVIVLDILLPELDGISLLDKLRKESIASSQSSVLMLSALDATEDKVRGLRAGADDYLAKPFSFLELQARIEALLRRRYGKKASLLKIGDLNIDLALKAVQRNGQTISLAPSEYQLLEFLALRAGDVVSRTEIEAHLYDEQTDLMSNAVDRTVCMLRRKLAITPNSSPLLHTHRGLGYRLSSADA
jgi:DNA-binding response OmpR family regulator